MTTQAPPIVNRGNSETVSIVTTRNPGLSGGQSVPGVLGGFRERFAWQHPPDPLAISNLCRWWVLFFVMCLAFTL